MYSLLEKPSNTAKKKLADDLAAKKAVWDTKVKAKFPTAIKTASGLYYVVDKPGNGALAKKWSDSKGTNDAYNNPVNAKKIVNIGDKKNGGCSDVNIGTVNTKRKAGEKAPKEIVVTAKDVINICK